MSLTDSQQMMNLLEARGVTTFEGLHILLEGHIIKRKKKTQRMPSAKDRCKARVWKGGLGGQCSSKAHKGDFCRTHRRRCKEGCPHGIVRANHLFWWEHFGRYDQPPPTTKGFKNLDCWSCGEIPLNDVERMLQEPDPLDAVVIQGEETTIDESPSAVVKNVLDELTEDEMGAVLDEITYINNMPFRETGGCRRRRNFTVAQPQLPEELRPSKGNWGKSPVGYRKEGKVYQCQLCPYRHKTTGSMQQHCLSHFPAKYGCERCGDCFHIKTQIDNHVDVECLTCFKVIKIGSRESHSESCKSR